VVGARQYDPSTGRFIADDPVLETSDPGQLNRYGYGGNNPLTHADPSGMKYEDPEERSGSNSVADGCQDGSSSACQNAKISPKVEPGWEQRYAYPIWGLVGKAAFYSNAAGYQSGLDRVKSYISKQFRWGATDIARSEASDGMRLFQSPFMKAVTKFGDSTLVKSIGIGGIALGAFATYEGEIDEGHSEIQASVATVATVGGGLAGAAVGAQAGAVAGMIIAGPVGAVVLGALGSVAGAIVGATAVQDVVDTIFSWF
jgi:hypothetical protein